ncbi:MAG: hypothetical protein AAB911_01165 [Patescibacteria group bacterium]
MDYQINKKLLGSKYRREMWQNSKNIIKKLEKVLPISEAYLMGGFTTKKPRPADVDFIILLKIKDKNHKAKWSVDLVIAPDNKYGQFVLEDGDKWVKEKYGLDKSTMIRIR